MASTTSDGSTSGSEVSSQSSRTPSPKKNKTVKKAAKGGKGKKKPLTAYMNYFMDRVQSKECKGVPVTQVAKMAGKEWGKMSTADKKKWEK